MEFVDLIAMFAEENPEETRKILDSVIESELDLDRAADLEIAREYFTNPEFKTALETFTFDTNNKE